MARPSLDFTWLRVAEVLASRGSCAKRQVGCVLVDAVGHVVGTGWNGRPKAMGNCSDSPCDSGCDGIHAEVNALLQAQGRARTAYVTHAPCWHCMKTIANSGVTKVVYVRGATLENRTVRLAEATGIILLCCNSQGDVTCLAV